MQSSAFYQEQRYLYHAIFITAVAVAEQSSPPSPLQSQAVAALDIPACPMYEKITRMVPSVESRRTLDCLLPQHTRVEYSKNWFEVCFMPKQHIKTTYAAILQAFIVQVRPIIGTETAVSVRAGARATRSAQDSTSHTVLHAVYYTA